MPRQKAKKKINKNKKNKKTCKRKVFNIVERKLFIVARKIFFIVVRNFFFSCEKICYFCKENFFITAKKFFCHRSVRRLVHVLIEIFFIEVSQVGPSIWKKKIFYKSVPV